MSKQPPKNIAEALTPVTDKIDQKSWEENQALSAGGAGASLAVLLVTVQVMGPNSGWLQHAAACLASVAILIWLALWQISDTNAFWRVRGVEQSKNVPWLIASGAVFIAGCLLLFMSIVLLVLTVSLPAAATMLMSVFVFGIFVTWHGHAAGRYGNGKPDVKPKPKALENSK